MNALLAAASLAAAPPYFDEPLSQDEPPPQNSSRQLSELFALVMASLVAQPALAHLHAALDAFGTKVRTMPAEALLHAEDDALDAIRLAVESRGDAEAEGSGS